MVREYFYKFINKDIKELNGIILSLCSILFLIGIAILSYKLTNNSYVLFRDNITGINTIEVEAIIPKKTLTIYEPTIFDLAVDNSLTDIEVLDLNGYDATITSSDISGYIEDITIINGTIRIEEATIDNLKLESSTITMIRGSITTLNIEGTQVQINGGNIFEMLTNNGEININGGNIYNINMEDNNIIFINSLMTGVITINGNDNTIYNYSGSSLNITNNGQNNSIL